MSSTDDAAVPYDDRSDRFGRSKVAVLGKPQLSRANKNKNSRNIGNRNVRQQNYSLKSRLLGLGNASHPLSFVVATERSTTSKLRSLNQIFPVPSNRAP